ncbi:uncharacterized protein TNCV_4375941 [Trichonephila clavipes]|uniref:Uncharacterized protein n=1 Tax=Trichonephila clavipes TaxID=2585209 RepID=A0A8X6W2C4_TRICX|nr:uncharacterized protein TNCV_4375941 [Trichonephila clavipes]
MSDITSIDRETIIKILAKNLHIVKVCAKLGPKSDQDNALVRVYIVLSVKQFLVSKHITVLEHPPCSQDLDPYDFKLVIKEENALKKTLFQSVGDGKIKTADLLKMVTTNEPQNCFEMWKTRMQQCIDR